jgi:serine/threonine-protein kinase
MTEQQHETVRVKGQGNALLLCLVCTKTFEAAALAAAGGDPRCPIDGFALMRLPEVDSKLVGNYSYRGLLGVGGMGVVFKAHNPYLDRLVAVKYLKGKKYDQKELHRFMQEGKLLGKLIHPNLVSVLDFGGNEQGEPYMVMEYLEGESLADLIHRTGTIALPLALEIVIQTCDGLAEAHKAGAVHRDIKPSNIFVMEKSGGKPVVKLLDFGIAKLCFPEDPAAAADLTRTGEIFGSPLYMSPEQALGKTVDERSDLYSLGCVLYEMLTGRPPVMGKTAMETIFKHVTDRPLPLNKAVSNKNYPASTQALIDCLLAKEPGDRFESAEELASMVRGLVSDNGSDSQKLNERARKLAMRFGKTGKWCRLVSQTGNYYAGGAGGDTVRGGHMVCLHL